jgi:cation diffusion facilitator CzcD-associated flavoprotein CzcO
VYDAGVPSVSKVLIIGAGFGGLGMAIALRKAGIDDVVVLEKGDEVGGCWRDNHYPGAACDVPSHLYSFSFEPKADWSRRFPPQAEILEYLKHCADKYDVRRKIRFGTEVKSAAFDTVEGLWRVTTTAGQQLQARVLVTASGQLNRPAEPRLPGHERFEGVSFHSARWNHAYDLTGKRVAVIGTGASAIQFVPAIIDRVEQLHLFQRSAAYVFPHPDREYTARERRLFARFPALQLLSRGSVYLMQEAIGLGFFRWPSLLKLLERRFGDHLEQSVRNPELRRKLTPDYPLGCKRMLISNSYYSALCRPNAELVTDPIETVTSRGIVTADGRERKLDAIIYGTGFAATEFLAPMTILGRDGRDLNQAWQGGAEAYLGVTVNGFPNLFMLYGPNTNLSHNSIVYMLECQIRYVVQCVQELDARKLKQLEVSARVQSVFNQELQHRFDQTTVWNDCTSWYKTADGKHTNNWPGFTLSYRRRTHKPNFADYELY